MLPIQFQRLQPSPAPGYQPQIMILGGRQIQNPQPTRINDLTLNNPNRGVQLMNGSNMQLYSSEIKLKSEGGAASPVVYHQDQFKSQQQQQHQQQQPQVVQVQKQFHQIRPQSSDGNRSAASITNSGYIAAPNQTIFKGGAMTTSRILLQSAPQQQQQQQQQLQQQFNTGNVIPQQVPYQRVNSFASGYSNAGIVSSPNSKATINKDPAGQQLYLSSRTLGKEELKGKLEEKMHLEGEKRRKAEERATKSDALAKRLENESIALLKRCEEAEKQLEAKEVLLKQSKERLHAREQSELKKGQLEQKIMLLEKEKEEIQINYENDRKEWEEYKEQLDEEKEKQENSRRVQVSERERHLQKELSELKEESEKRINELERELQGIRKIEEKVSAREIKVEEEKRNMLLESVNLKEEIKELRQRICEYEGVESEATGEVVKLNSKIAMYAEELGKSESQLESKRKECMDLQTLNQELNGCLAEQSQLQNQYDELRILYEETQSGKELEEEVILQNSLLNSQIIELNQAHQDALDTITQLQVQLQKYSQIQNSQKALQSQLQIVREQNEALDKEKTLSASTIQFQKDIIKQLKLQIAGDAGNVEKEIQQSKQKQMKDTSSNDDQYKESIQQLVREKQELEGILKDTLNKHSREIEYHTQYQKELESMYLIKLEEKNKEILRLSQNSTQFKQISEPNGYASEIKINGATKAEDMHENGQDQQRGEYIDEETNEILAQAISFFTLKQPAIEEFYKAQVIEFELKLQEKQIELNAAKNQIDESEKQIEQLLTQIEEKDNIAGKMRERILELEGEVASLRVNLAERSEESDTQITEKMDMESKMSEINRELETLKGENELIVKENSQLRESLEQRKVEIEEYNLHLDQISHKISDNNQVEYSRYISPMKEFKEANEEDEDSDSASSSSKHYIKQQFTVDHMYANLEPNQNESIESNLSRSPDSTLS